MICFSFYSSLSLREKNGGKKNLFISNYHRSDVAFMLRPFRRHFMPSQRKRHCCRLLSFLSVFLHMVEAQRENLKDDFVQNFHPISFFILLFHFQS